MTAPSSWRLPPADLALSPDAVHAWRGALDLAPAPTETLAMLLSPDEQVRAHRFRFGRDRRRFVAARGQLRLILARYLGCEPAAIAFRYGPQGKPELAADTSLRFNLSHAGGRVLYAVTQQRRVGVDIEPIRTLPDADQLVERFFSTREVAAYRALPTRERPAAFFTCWTRKEAFIKALGEGLSYPLDAFDVPVRPEEPAALLSVRTQPRAAAAWHLQAVPVEAGYAATLAAEAPPWRLTCWDADALMRSYSVSASYST